MLFQFPEHTYLGAFTYAALTAAIATGLVLEYRVTDPFATYSRRGREQAYTESVDDAPHLLQTCAVAFISTLLTLVILHRLFALGAGMLAAPGVVL